MVGYAERASWKMQVPPPPVSVVDEELNRQVTKLASSLREKNGEIEFPNAAERQITDGFEILDLANNEVLGGGYWIPSYLPRDVPLPRDGTSFRLQNGELFVTRVDANQRLLAVSSESAGGWWSLAALFVLVFLVAGVVAYLSGRTFLRKYFLFNQTRPRTVEEAVKLGEGPAVEFKRSMSFEISNSVEQVLQTVAAFSNSGDGTIFIGIEDNAAIKGIKLDGTKHRDQFAQRIYQVVRHRIKPAPWIQVDFVVVGDHEVCTVFVPRGEEPLHFLDGVVFVRYGASDIKAEPEIVRRLLTVYAF